MTRPSGRVRIRKTRQVSPVVRIAELSGGRRGTLLVVRKGEDFYAFGPTRQDVAREVPADNFTDALHQEVKMLDREISRKKGPSR